MNKTIWKWTSRPTDHVTLEVPTNSELLSIQNQEDRLAYWFLIDKAQLERETWQFDIFGTGHDVKTDFPYIGTLQFGRLVLHVFGGKQ